MGAKDIDLAPIFAALVENMQQYGINYSMAGKLSFYLIYKVTGADAQQYTVATTEGAEMTMTISMSGSYGGQQVSGSGDATMVVKIDGTSYFTKDNLALKRLDATIDMDMTFTASGTGMGTIGATSYSGTMDVSGSLSITYDPPLNLFDFPISAGDSWSINSTATMTGNLTGKISMPGYGDYSLDTPLTTTIPISISASCTGTQNYTLPDGSTTTAYKIVYSGTSLGGSNPFIPAATIYYSPDQGFIVAQELSFDDALGGMTVGTQEDYKGYTFGASDVKSGQALFTMAPMTEAEARSAIGGLGKAEAGADLVLIGAIVAVLVIVIVLIVVAVLLVRRRRAAPLQTTV